jgi:outer membrane protein OmpA-like peptidoglycan-associated protein
MTDVGHNEIPAEFGWRLLADAGSNVPRATLYTGAPQPSREGGFESYEGAGEDDESLAWLDVEAQTEEFATEDEDEVESESEGEAEDHWEAESEGAFPSGKTLTVTTGASKIGEEFFDPYFSQNPLLDVSGSKASTKLSPHFTAGEFARSGSVRFAKARIDPALVECMEAIRVFLKTAVTILDGYYSFKYLKALPKQQGIDQPAATPHLSGRGARFQAGGLTGVELAKAVVFCCPNDTSIAIGETSVSVYVKQPKPEVTSFIKNGEQAERAIHLIRQYRLLFFSDAAMLAATRTDLYGIRLFVHGAIHKHQLRDENLLADVAFYKSDYVKNKRTLYKVSGRFDKTKSVDLELRKEIIDKIIKPELGEVVGPPAQRGGVPTTPKGERKKADPQPDKVPVDITGRYETIHADKSEELGKTMCINQAGTHIEVVISPVNSPSAPATTTRYANRYYGTLEAGGAWKIFSREGSVLDSIRLVPRTGGLNFEWKSGGQSGTEQYRRVSDSPILLEAAISTFDKADRPLLEAYENRPLLQSQITFLRQIFADPQRIGKLLNDFYNPKCDPIQQWDEYCQGQATKAFGGVKKWLSDPSRGFHASDRALALFYIRHYLTYNRWRPSTSYPFLPALDWSQRAVSVVEYQSKHHPNRTGTTDASALTGDLVDIMGLKTEKDSDGHIHTYKVTMKLYGATAVIGGMGGTLTVEKTDSKPWPAPNKESFTIWFVTVGAGVKWKKGKGVKSVGPFKAGETYVGQASSNFYWLPNDFPSQIRVAIAEASAQAGAKVGGEGGFMHILGRGSLPVLQVIFSDSEVKAGGTTVGAGAEIIAGIGKIRDKDFKDVEYPVTPDKSDYAVAYHQNDDTYFGYNSALLKEGARKALRTMCAHELVALMSAESTLVIEGHTDVEGKAEDNQVLSDLRATNTRQGIVDILGSRLQCKVEAKGFGETEGAKAKETRRNQDRRRVDLKLNGRLVLQLRDK